MKIEIWSDIMCPFCYIGKRRFEEALASFPHRDEVEVVWKSFQLNPDLEYKEGDNLNSYLARHKGWTEDYARQANAHVSNMAREAGLQFDLEKAIPANTLKAHRLLHLAKSYGKQTAMEEKLFSAYFTEGKNVGDDVTLLQLASALGLPEQEVEAVLKGNAFTQEVYSDQQEAQQIGVRGVPFFVLDRRYAVSGAQSTEAFGQAFEKAFQESAATTATDGDSCAVDGEC